jgi:hypothetical protein
VSLTSWWQKYVCEEASRINKKKQAEIDKHTIILRTLREDLKKVDDALIVADRYMDRSSTGAFSPYNMSLQIKNDLLILRDFANEQGKVMRGMITDEITIVTKWFTDQGLEIPTETK